MNAIELLQLARTRIEAGWTQGWFARDQYNMRVQVYDENATCFCLAGALCNTWCRQEEHHKSIALLRSVLGTKYENIVQFNDSSSTTKEDVLKLIDAAIIMGTLVH